MAGATTLTVKLRKPWTPKKFQECWLCTGQSQNKLRTQNQTSKLQITVAVSDLVTSRLFGLFLVKQ